MRIESEICTDRTKHCGASVLTSATCVYVLVRAPASKAHYGMPFWFRMEVWRATIGVTSRLLITTGVLVHELTLGTRAEYRRHVACLCNQIFGTLVRVARCQCIATNFIAQIDTIWIWTTHDRLRIRLEPIARRTCVIVTRALHDAARIHISKHTLVAPTKVIFGIFPESLAKGANQSVAPRPLDATSLGIQIPAFIALAKQLVRTMAMHHVEWAMHCITPVSYNTTACVIIIGAIQVLARYTVSMLCVKVFRGALEVGTSASVSATPSCVCSVAMLATACLFCRLQPADQGHRTVCVQASRSFFTACLQVSFRALPASTKYLCMVGPKNIFRRGAVVAGAYILQGAALLVRCLTASGILAESRPGIMSQSSSCGAFVRIAATRRNAALECIES
mmetsp:Transcript_8394/g.21125  ORF Transcript_8394/g.21125 Transcript_8394/m.21125 type:complete len:394 (-) Transcript_8394:1268-2449(-)